jgi:L-alanine-DL-glutamate epimerase-like enolase superfamily enzyme
MKLRRRDLLKTGAGLASASAWPSAAFPAQGARSYPYLGRTAGYADFAVIPRGSTITRVESWTQGPYGFVRLTTNDGREGWGQMSVYEPDISAMVLHRQVAPHVLGSDPALIDDLVDRVIDANMKFPWSYVCRALCGVDTAIWDLYGKVKGQPVCALLGGKAGSFPVYGSSMRRDITPEAEGARLARLRDEKGFTAFKVRLGTPTGHDGDASPGRSEKVIPAARKAVGASVRLMGDANSCYTPPKAIEIGRRLEDQGYFWYEEPCPYWELEWSAEVVAALKIPVSGGEQDNDLAQWRRMIRMKAVDILQPDLCYVGGITRAWRVAKMGQDAGLLVEPHSANLSLATLFSLHLMAAIRNAGPFAEFSIEDDVNAGEKLYGPALTVADGKVRIPDGPGWGVTINRGWLEKASYQKSEKAAR